MRLASTRTVARNEREVRPAVRIGRRGARQGAGPLRGADGARAGVPRGGLLLMYGPFGDPQEEGSMAIFTSREAAEEFARDDRFVVNGVRRGWQIREWNEAFAP